MSSFCKCKTISVYAIFNYQSFNDTLTNDILSFDNWTQYFRMSSAAVVTGALTICMLGNFACFLLSVCFFFVCFF